MNYPYAFGIVRILYSNPTCSTTTTSIVQCCTKQGAEIWMEYQEWMKEGMIILVFSNGNVYEVDTDNNSLHIDEDGKPEPIGTIKITTTMNLIVAAGM